MKILIVDDSSVARKMLRKCITWVNADIYEATNGKEALKKFEEIRPSLTFMDLTMPIMDGYDAIAAIKKRFGDANIVVMSADVQQKSMERVRDLGVKSFLKKPARPDPVQTILNEFAESSYAESDEMISSDEREVLQEIMNIAFGNAAADLAEVIDIYLDLSTPQAYIMNIGEMAKYLKDIIPDDAQATSTIIQNFWGDFNGFGILLLPYNAGRSLLKVLEEHTEMQDDEGDKPIVSQEREVLLEIGNILVGACVGKVCELLNTFVTYNPPQFVSEEGHPCDTFTKNFDPTQAAIVMETIFRFDQIDIKGQLLIITHQETIQWLRTALRGFVESYT